MSNAVSFCQVDHYDLRDERNQEVIDGDHLVYPSDFKMQDSESCHWFQFKENNDVE
ncbi:hypothetical protein L4C38_11170 [Vibrio kasasachensis]|uniref:hypothetical protein n=1 Tax=Vibrio kasasachensis TaxID=2910248 RepID=UPI003D12D9B0